MCRKLFFYIPVCPPPLRRLPKTLINSCVSIGMKSLYMCIYVPVCPPPRRPWPRPCGGCPCEAYTAHTYTTHRRADQTTRPLAVSIMRLSFNQDSPIMPLSLSIMLFSVSRTRPCRVRAVRVWRVAPHRCHGPPQSWRRRTCAAHPRSPP